MSSPGPSGIRQELATADHPAVVASTLESFSVGEIQIRATVTEVAIVPSVALTGGANPRTFTLTNQGPAGLGVGTVPALVTIATLTTTAGLESAIGSGDWVAFNEKLFTLSAVAGALDVSVGDVLSCVETGASAVAHGALQLVVRGVARP